MPRWPKEEGENPKKGKKPEAKRRRRVAEQEADWSSTDAGLLQDVIANVTSDGGAIRFGYSRDGGAYSIGIYGDGKPFSEFLGATEDIESWLEGLKLDYE